MKHCLFFLLTASALSVIATHAALSDSAKPQAIDPTYGIAVGKDQSTPPGPIHMDVRRNKGDWTTLIDLPGGVIASVSAPGQVSTVNGRKSAANAGVLKFDKGGRYTIVSK